MAGGLYECLYVLLRTYVREIIEFDCTFDVKHLMTCVESHRNIQLITSHVTNYTKLPVARREKWVFSCGMDYNERLLYV